MAVLASMISALIFVALAGINVWIMLARPVGSDERRWTRLHRVVGYVFVGIYVFQSYVMFLRVKGYPDELQPRILLHMVLALLIAPLLVMKIVLVRGQRASRGLLAAIGISIFAISFALVALNISVHYLESASPAKVPAAYLILFVVSVVAVLGLLLRGKRASIPAEKTVSNQPTPSRSMGLEEQSRSLVLTRVDSQTHDSKTLRFLVKPDQRISARPGQFLTFEWTIDGKKVYRSYSICSSPTQTGYIEITPKKVVNGCVSVFLNESAQPGLFVKVRGPFGNFFFDEQKHKSIVLVAGGSGITPMMAMLRYIDDLCIPVPVTLIYCVRSETDVIFGGELSSLQSRLQSFKYVLVLSQPSAEWKGARGRLNQTMLEAEIKNAREKTFFLCGPGQFMDHVQGVLQKMGIAPTQILRESFGSEPALQSEGNSYRLEFVRSSTAFTTTTQATVLEAAEMQGVQLPYGCRHGSCGTCATKLLGGHVVMERQEALTEEMKNAGYILPCVSHAVSDIRLDA